MNKTECDRMEQIKHAAAVARGDQPADLLLLNGQVIDVFNSKVNETNVAIAGGVIAALGDGYKRGKEVIDLAGKFIAPGLIDAHLHVESTLLLPPELGRVLVGQGTTAVIHDPHEIANVLGPAGVELMIELSRQSPCDFFATVPSSVPATDLETAGGKVSAAQVEGLLGRKEVVGLGEMMNYPGVIAAEEEICKKIMAARRAGKVIDGHAPGLSGKDLQAYLSTGISTDHECITAKEAREKMAMGMKIIIRHGSATSSLAELLPLVDKDNCGSFMFGSDDREAGELLEKGHLNEVLGKAVALNKDPLEMIKLATINTARHYRLYDRGAVAPGYRADLVVFDNLEHFRADVVIKNGREAARDGKPCRDFKAVELPREVRQSIKLSRPLVAGDFSLQMPAGPVPVIGVIAGQLVTDKLFMEVEHSKEGHIPAVPAPGVNKIAVVERHGKNGNIAVGLIRGLGLERGALASSVAHDSHNLVVVGAGEEEMAAAVNELARAGGGFVALDDRPGGVKVLPLEAAGLMSVEPAAVVAKKMAAVLAAARELGTKLPQPFLTLSFMALPVIPSLKITDRGLVDVDRFSFL